MDMNMDDQDLAYDLVQGTGGLFFIHDGQIKRSRYFYIPKSHIPALFPNWPHLPQDFYEMKNRVNTVIDYVRKNRRKSKRERDEIEKEYPGESLIMKKYRIEKHGGKALWDGYPFWPQGGDPVVDDEEEDDEVKKKCLITSIPIFNKEITEGIVVKNTETRKQRALFAVKNLIKTLPKLEKEKGVGKGKGGGKKKKVEVVDLLTLP